MSGVRCAIHRDVALDDDGSCIRCDLEDTIKADDELAEMSPSPLRDLLESQPPFSVPRHSVEYPRADAFSTPRRHGPIVAMFTVWCWCQRLRKTRRIYVGQRIDVWIPAHRSKIGTFKQGLGASRVFSLGVVFVRWWYEPKARRPSLIADVRNRVAP